MILFVFEGGKAEPMVFDSIGELFLSKEELLNFTRSYVRLTTLTLTVTRWLFTFLCQLKLKQKQDF